MKRTETRLYPTCCTSNYCDKIDCPTTCANLQKLQEFKAWKKRTNAVCADPIWSPNFYVAQDQKNENP